MKYVLVDEDNIIVHISETLGYQSNGNYLVDNGELAIVKQLIANVYEVENIPEEIAPVKYCYNVEQGFYKNKDYREYYSPEQRISALEDAVNMLLGF